MPRVIGIGGVFLRSDDREPLYTINSIVEDLDGLLASMRAEGQPVEDRVEDTEFGRFGWVTDPEGNRSELWEPPRQADTAPVG